MTKRYDTKIRETKQKVAEIIVKVLACVIATILLFA